MTPKLPRHVGARARAGLPNGLPLDTGPDNLPPYHAAVWIDHREANFFECIATDVAWSVVQSHESGRRLLELKNYAVNANSRWRYLGAA